MHNDHFNTNNFVLLKIQFAVENDVQGSWLQEKPLLEECTVRKICQELKGKIHI